MLATARPSPSVPRLLFTHIPLWRSPDTDCGDRREAKGGLREGGGYQYQNMLDLPLTTRILDLVWPIQGAFSGDDHDYCEAVHTIEGRRESFVEYTVKSFSWAMVWTFLPPGPSVLGVVVETD